MVLMVIALIIVLIVIDKDNKKQQERLIKKIQELEQELSQYKNKGQVPVEKTHQEKTEIINESIQETIKPLNTNSNQIVVKKEIKPKDTEGIKNKFILMTGAILIVLAAIVFLTSTWHTIPDILKTSVIILLTGVFVGASSIARKVFKLEETANTFLYIALAYLPISLFSISLFGLLGDYFSITGAGNNIYFAISTLILSILYFTIGNKRKQNVLFHSSMIMQLLATIFISLCINRSINAVVLGIIIYNTILNLIKNTYFKEYSNIIKFYNDVYLYITLVIEVILLNVGTMLIDIVSNLLLIYNMYLKYKNNKNYINIIFILIQVLVLAVSFLNINSGIFDIQLSQVIFYVILNSMYLVGIINKKTEWKESSILVSTVAMILLYLSTFTYYDVTLILERYMILWTIAIFNIISYNILNRKTLCINLIPISIFLATTNTIIENNLSINYLILVESGVFIFSILNLLKEKENNFILQTYSNIMTLFVSVIVLMFNFNNTISNTLIFVLLTVIYGIGYLKNKNMKIYKFISYSLLNVVFFSILYNYSLFSYYKYIFFITTTIITLIELYLNKKDDIVSAIYLMILYGLSYITLNIGMDIVSFVSILGLDIMFILYISNKKFDKKWLMIPFISIIPGVYIYNFGMLYETNIMTLVSFGLIALTTILSIKKEKINIYTIISAVYILMQTISFGLSIYINLIIAILWSVVHYIKIPKDKLKFEILLYILGLILYNNIISDCSKIYDMIDSISAFKYLGYMVFIICITRNILKKNSVVEYKIIEYIVFSILYLSAIGYYTSETDGMIFVFMTICIMAFSYIKKFGPVFFTSLIAIILNIFLLTREFWFSVPWWIYMLTIGSALIMFAIKNELNENKDKEMLKKKMKTFKDYIDM